MAARMNRIWAVPQDVGLDCTFLPGSQSICPSRKCRHNQTVKTTRKRGGAHEAFSDAIAPSRSRFRFHPSQDTRACRQAIVRQPRPRGWMPESRPHRRRMPAAAACAGLLRPWPSNRSSAALNHHVSRRRQPVGIRREVPRSHGAPRLQFCLAWRCRSCYLSPHKR